MNDPLLPNQAYLFATDNGANSEIFGVFKMDFTPSTPKYVYTSLTMNSGKYFSVNSIFRTSQTDPNDFIFAGKAQSLTDGITIKTLPSGTGYVMKA